MLLSVEKQHLNCVIHRIPRAWYAESQTYNNQQKAEKGKKDEAPFEHNLSWP